LKTQLKVRFETFLTNVVVLDRIKSDLFKAKNTVRSLGRTFTILDTNNDRVIDKQEFYWGLKNLGCAISKREASVLLEYLDTSKDGFVSFNEFIIGVRGLPN
jgi:Ca2+-binding EF-hand superfamily protein